MPALLCFWPCFWAMCRGCTLWHQGAHPAKLPSGVCLPPCPGQPQDGSVGCCQQPFPAARLAQCAGRPGLALRWGECWWPLTRATMQQPLRKCRHEEMLGMLPLPPPPSHPHRLPNTRPGRGLQPRRAPAPPAQPLPLQVALASGGGDTHPAPAVEGLSCQSSASIASFFGKPRHAEVETWPVCKQAPGLRGFLYKGCFFR